MKAAVLTYILATATAISPAFAQTITPDSSEARALAAFQPGPMRRVPGSTALINGVSAVESYNWGGYAVSGTGFTDAKGSWVVPTVDCSKSPNALVAFWVGIDGFSNSTVEQTGTLTFCLRTTAQYYTWYEFYPSPLTFISTVSSRPGDKMYAEVSYDKGEFTVEITNETAGQSFSLSQAVPGAKRTSAEWITEAPSTITGITNLADFTKVSFGEDYTGDAGTNSATDSIVSGTIGDFGSAVYRITQVDFIGFTESTSSALKKDGASFTVTWVEYN
jgi:hypothetical protein